MLRRGGKIDYIAIFRGEILLYSHFSPCRKLAMFNDIVIFPGVGGWWLYSQFSGGGGGMARGKNYYIGYYDIIIIPWGLVVSLSVHPISRLNRILFYITAQNVIHGILNPIPMVFWPPYPRYLTPYLWYFVQVNYH